MLSEFDLLTGRIHGKRSGSQQNIVIRSDAYIAYADSAAATRDLRPGGDLSLMRTLQIIDGMVYIDGEMLDESYGKEVMDYAGIASEPVELGQDEYFVLGDNRNNSSDSRDPSVGIIHGDQIIGKAFIRIWPLNKFGILKHQ